MKIRVDIRQKIWSHIDKNGREMRFLVLLFIYNVQVRGFFKFKEFGSKTSVSENEEFSGYKKSVSVTGNYVVNVLLVNEKIS